jgi:hypothetical protein
VNVEGESMGLTLSPRALDEPVTPDTTSAEGDSTTRPRESRSADLGTRERFVSRAPIGQVWRLSIPSRKKKEAETGVDRTCVESPRDLDQKIVELATMF